VQALPPRAKTSTLRGRTVQAGGFVEDSVAWIDSPTLARATLPLSRDRGAPDSAEVLPNHLPTNAKRRPGGAAFRIPMRWRGPESTWRHHDFQSRIRTRRFGPGCRDFPDRVRSGVPLVSRGFGWDWDRRAVSWPNQGRSGRAHNGEGRGVRSPPPMRSFGDVRITSWLTGGVADRKSGAIRETSLFADYS
jgi:hypothetical protein